MSLPDVYLDLPLRTIVALTGKPHRRGTRCKVSTAVAAVKALDAQLAKRAAAQRVKDADWLTTQFEALTTSLPEAHK